MGENVCAGIGRMKLHQNLRMPKGFLTDGPYIYMTKVILQKALFENLPETF